MKRDIYKIIDDLVDYIDELELDEKIGKEEHDNIIEKINNITDNI